MSRNSIKIGLAVFVTGVFISTVAFFGTRLVRSEISTNTDVRFQVATKPPAPQRPIEIGLHKIQSTKPLILDSAELSTSHPEELPLSLPEGRLSAKTSKEQKIPDLVTVQPRHPDAERREAEGSPIEILRRSLPRSPQATKPARPPTGGQAGAPQDDDEVSERFPTLEEVIFKKARPIESHNKPPRYPRVARKNGYQGKVVLDLEVNEAGKVSGVAIARSSGYRTLDREAVRTVRDWRFLPAEKLGSPVLCHLEVPVIYRLNAKSQDK